MGMLPNLILRSIGQAMRLEGWPRMTAVQAAIRRDDRLRCTQPISYATTAKPLREDEVLGI
jgi:hypothetical protein